MVLSLDVALAKAALMQAKTIFGGCEASIAQ